MNVYSLAEYAKVTNELRKRDKSAYNTFIAFNYAATNCDFDGVKEILGDCLLKEEHIRCVINKLSNRFPVKGNGADKMIQFLKFHLLTL